MVAATLVLLCSRPQDVAAFGQVQWLLVVPSIAIIGREVLYDFTCLLFFFLLIVISSAQGLFFLPFLSCTGIYCSC